MQTVGKPPAATIRSMARFVDSTGSRPAMISPETRPRPSLPAVYSSASKKASWPTVDALPGQTSSNHFLSRSSTQKEKWSHPSSISSSYSSQHSLQDGDGLDADEAADVPADGRDEGPRLHEAVHRPSSSGRPRSGSRC